MNNYQFAKGSTDVSVVIQIVDSTDGTPETGVVFNTAGLALEYRREGTASTAITEVTLAALTTAHTDGGFLHIGNGHYRLDLPDAACASGVNGVLVHGTCTGMVVIGAYIQLTTVDLIDSDFVTTALAAIHLDHLLAVNYDPASKPGVGTALLNELVENDGGVSRFTLNALEQGPSGSGASASAIADAVWDEATSGHATAGTFGEAATDIKAKTDSLTFTVANQVDANVQSINETNVSGVGTTGTPWSG